MSFPVLLDSRQPEVHASTILLLENKSLLCAWFGGTKEGNSDVRIWLSRLDLSTSDAGAGAEWTTSVPVTADDGLPHWNPVLMKVDKKVVLFYKVGTPISSWYTHVMESDDEGVTWSATRELVPGDIGGRGPVKNKAIFLSDGTILAPASLESPDGWDCFVDRSHDQGKTWSRSPFVPLDREHWPGEGAIQPSLVDYAPGTGKISMLTRSSAGFVARSDSEDNGETWGKLYNTSLFNNNSGLDALRLDNGAWVVVHNPIQKNWGPRTPLVVSTSLDEGKTWRIVLQLETKPRPSDFEKKVKQGIVRQSESEFSYPAIISDGKDGVYVSYTYERNGIKVVHIDGDKLGSLE